MANAPLLHPDRLLPIDPQARDVARRLYNGVERLPIVSPHGHTDPLWFAENANFSDPVSVFLTPDHYLIRMLYKRGLSLHDLGIRKPNEKPASFAELRQAWRLFAQNFHLFRATPSALWLAHVFHSVFAIDRPFNVDNADHFFDVMNEKLATPEFRPRALYERFQIEVLATTDSATDTLEHHARISREWKKLVLPTYRPDSAIDPEHEDFAKNLETLSDQTGCDATTWAGYLEAHRARRLFFKKHGATATDHGHRTASTLYLNPHEAEVLFHKISKPGFDAADAERFRAHMLWRMAEMSQDDGLAMQIHPGVYRNHNRWLMENYGRDRGGDIPTSVEFTKSLKPLLDSFGNRDKFKLILFTLDESTYSRELAPLAGHYPALRLGPAWWFHDSPEGMIRHRRWLFETAGFSSFTGFIDDTRAFFSIPARHDMARRIDARILSELVCEHRLSEEDASDLITQLSGALSREAYGL